MDEPTKSTHSDAELEAQLAAQSPAARVTLAQVQANIVSAHYFTAAQGVRSAAVDDGLTSDEVPAPLRLLTICVLVLRNGFTVTGTSACVSPANFDPEVGKRIAYQKALDQVWPLMGYALAERLADAAVAA